MIVIFQKSRRAHSTSAGSARAQSVARALTTEPDGRGRATKGGDDGR